MHTHEEPEVARRYGAERESLFLPGTEVLDGNALLELARRCGADDAGLVDASRESLGVERDHVQRLLPGARTLLSFVRRMNREPIRAVARSVSNLEFHHTGDDVDETARRIVRELERVGVRAVNPSMGFPMEMAQYPGRIWAIAHKPIAVEAGLGHIGLHRNVIHPKFGNFVLLGTIVIENAASTKSAPIEFNPCFSCKLCVAACPVGAIEPDGRFDFGACATHNYREFMGGFVGWIETIADSRDASDYRSRVTDSESASLWQSLSFGPNYKAAYCLAVCPAGEDVIGAYETDKRGHLNRIVRPLQDKVEDVYVVAGSDAQAHVLRRFPKKRVRIVPSSLRPTTIAGFLRGLPLLFQRGQAGDVVATYHFTFSGDESARATVRIDHGSLTVRDGHEGQADLRLEADAVTWLGFLRGDHGIAWALIRRKVRIHGPLKWMRMFQRCFPR